MQKIILTPIPLEELKQTFSDIVRRELAEFSPNDNGNEAEQYFTREQTSQRLGISKPTLHDYTRRGIIKAHRLGSRVLYRETDIQTALREIKYAKTKG